MESIKCPGCGMTMDEPDDFGLGNIESKYCRYCTDENGDFFEKGELLKAMTKANVFSMGVNLDIAQNIARQNLANDKKLDNIINYNLFDMYM